MGGSRDAECGCSFVTLERGYPVTPRLTRCILHANAHVLLEALRDCVATLDRIAGSNQEPYRDCAPSTRARAKAILEKIGNTA